MAIELNNFTSFAVGKKLFTGVAKKVLIAENRRIENLSIAFVSSAEIKKLNKKFRGKDKPTDVLSFEGINEVVICPEVVKENAKKYGNSFEKEMAKVLIHGILHLCGYDHEKSKKEAREMEKREEKYLSK